MIGQAWAGAEAGRSTGDAGEPDQFKGDGVVEVDRFGVDRFESEAAERDRSEVNGAEAGRRKGDGAGRAWGAVEREPTPDPAASVVPARGAVDPATARRVGVDRTASAWPAVDFAEPDRGAVDLALTRCAETERVAVSWEEMDRATTAWADRTAGGAVRERGGT
ncbi:hypothetical protein, partial [Nonomuraea diastatica]